MNQWNVVGVMTGTSLDAVDLVHVEFSSKEEGWEFKILHSQSDPIPQKWVDRLYLLGDQSAEIFAKTNVYFGHFLGKEIQTFIKKNGLNPSLVACHGQTIFHEPDKSFTSQIGDGETIVSYLECPLVSNFRNKDVSLGGQGAPLVPFGDLHLFNNYSFCLNLGGFANISSGEIAFDICAVNYVLNWLVQQIDSSLRYDNHGKIARSGKLDTLLLERLDQLPFYQKQPPKSLGREWVEQFVYPVLQDSTLELKDILHTYCHHIAQQIRKSILSLPKQREKILVTGGGFYNSFLIELISIQLAGIVEVEKSPEKGIVDFKESLIFGFLGLNTLLGKPNILASVTGATQNVCGGSIHLPPAGYKINILNTKG